MLEGLQKKWKVNGLQMILILCTFAIGGSLTGYAGRKLMNLFGIESTVLWVIVYILLITILWPLAVLLVSIPFGQYRFFTKYLNKIGKRLGIVSRQSTFVSEQSENQQSAIGSLQSETSSIQNPTSKTHHLISLAIFASGAGSNAQRIIDHFRNSAHVKIALIVCNKPGAGVLNIAEKENIPVQLIEKERFFRGDAYINVLEEKKIDLVILAGFLWKIPSAIIKAYPGKIINIHPALLPKYGGKGMYGVHVHAAVLTAGDSESGITIHYVDEQYDHGATIFQATCEVHPNDTPDSLAQRIHKLEHEHFPKVIEAVINRF